MNEKIEKSGKGWKSSCGSFVSQSQDGGGDSRLAIGSLRLSSVSALSRRGHGSAPLRRREEDTGGEAGCKDRRHE